MAQAAPTLLQLNIHKPEKTAPSATPSLPIAPSPTPPRGQARPAPAGGEPPLGGSRLNGLTPYPYGAMPSGGSGLRGSLVGCANADAVALSSVERARCDERLGGAIGAAPLLDGISPAKRAAFDKASERLEEDRRYRDSAPSGPSSPHPLSSGPGDTGRGPSSVISSTPQN
jgi:hypothetical protein